MVINFHQFNREFAEEYYYVLINQKKLIRNPHKRIRRTSTSYYGYCALSLFVFAIGLSLVMQSLNYLLAAIVTGLTLAIIVAVTFKIHQAIINLAQANYKKYQLNITAKNLTYTLPGGTLVLEWDEILGIIFTPHTIVILPKTTETIPMCIPIEAKAKLESELKKLKHTDLIVK